MVKEPINSHRMISTTRNTAFEQVGMSSELANTLAKGIVKSLLQRGSSEHINDDRRVQILSRSKSRFSGPIVSNEVLALEFHPSGNQLAYSRIDGSLTVWLLQHLSFARSTKIYVPDACGSNKAIHSISWNPTEDGQFVSTSNSRKVTIWGVDNSTHHASKLKTFKVGSKLKIHKALFNSTGSRLVTISKSDEIHLFNVHRDYKFESSYKVPKKMEEDCITTVGWNNNGSYLILGMKMGGLQLLKVNSQNQFELCLDIPAHRSEISTLCVDPYGAFIITGSKDGICSIWDLATFTCSKTISDIDSAIDSIDITSSAKIMSICTRNKAVSFYDIISGKKIDEINCSKFDSDLAFKFYPNKCWFIISGKDDMLMNHFTPNNQTNEMELWKNEQKQIGPDSRSSTTIANTKSNTYASSKKLVKRKERDWDLERDSKSQKRERPPPRVSRFLNR